MIIKVRICAAKIGLVYDGIVDDSDKLVGFCNLQFIRHVIYMDWGKFCKILCTITLYKWYMYEHCLLRHWQRSTSFFLVYQWFDHTFILSFTVLSEILESSKRDLLIKWIALKWPVMSLSALHITCVGDAYTWTNVKNIIFVPDHFSSSCASYYGVAVSTGDWRCDHNKENALAFSLIWFNWDKGMF